MAVPARIGVGSGRTDTAGRADGIELRGLAKSYRSGETVIPAVRGVDVSIALGETVALLGPNGAGKSTTIDMLLGLAQPDAGTVSVFGQEPSAAIRAGRVGAMLQTGSLLRDLTVRELVAMMAALFPRPLDVDEVLEVAGIAGIAGQSHAEAVRRPDPACPLRPGARPRPGAARPRRAHRGHGRRGPPRVLDDDARLRGAGQDGPVRDALPRGGRRLRRPDRAHGARIDRRRRPDHRDQGDGRLPHDPRDAAPMPRRRSSSGCRA